MKRFIPQSYSNSVFCAAFAKLIQESMPGRLGLIKNEEKNKNLNLNVE